MAKDDQGYSDKPFSPGSESDPRAKRGSEEPTNPPARETYPPGPSVTQPASKAKDNA